MKIMSTILAILCIQCSLYSVDESHLKYLSLLEQHYDALGPIGNWKEGEIELVTDPIVMKKIEKETGRKVGIVAQDNYWIWINDPVIFPTGNTGVYGRLLWNRGLEDKMPGVAVLPIDKEKGVIYLICNFRHSTRSWELELPRGVRNPGESVMDAARREVKEETGIFADRMKLLGTMAPDTGKTSSIVPIVLAEVMSFGKPTPQESEAICGMIGLKFDKLKKLIKNGEFTQAVNGHERIIYVRDSFLAYALMLLELKGFEDLE